MTGFPGRAGDRFARHLLLLSSRTPGTRRRGAARAPVPGASDLVVHSLQSSHLSSGGNSPLPFVAQRSLAPGHGAWDVARSPEGCASPPSREESPSMWKHWKVVLALALGLVVGLLAARLGTGTGPAPAVVTPAA